MQKDKVEEKEQEQEVSIPEEQVTEEKSQGQTEEVAAEAGTEAGKEEADELTRLKNELEESKDKYLRLYSEFENFRRRTAKEKIELIGSATSELMVELIPVLDDFERALKSLEEKPEAAASKEGIELIHSKFRKTLENKGLKKMELNKGDDFNDDLHEAITQIPAGEELEGKVVDVIEQGYFLNDKVVRFAKVVTGAKS